VGRGGGGEQVGKLEPAAQGEERGEELPRGGVESPAFEACPDEEEGFARRLEEEVESAVGVDHAAAFALEPIAQKGAVAQERLALLARPARLDGRGAGVGAGGFVGAA
jgi:hypothetical protein